MGYYQGDFYRGDYYRGDPGILGFLGKAFKTVASVGSSFIPGVGGVAGKLISKLPIGGRGVQIVKQAGAAIVRHPVLSGAAAAGVVGAASVAMSPGAGAMTMPGGAPLALPGAGGLAVPGMRGFHISKKTGRLVRNRRMRVTNPKALRRAIRRAHGFEKLARRVMRFTSPRAPHGRAVFKKRARRK